MLKKLLKKFFARTIYPTKKKDWYKHKGYFGTDETHQFENFIQAQKKPNSIYYKEFINLNLKRQFIISGNEQLDSIIISMPTKLAKNKPGFGLFFVFFQGREEYYESRFRDMARQCQETGASVLGFNPKGLNSSSGSTEEIFDLVRDGISIINYLLSQEQKLDRIILQGNSLGSGVQEMVSKHFQITMGKPIRQINSNSFRSLSAVFSHYYRIPFLEKYLEIILRYSGWEIEVDKDFYTTGPHRCYFRRFEDKTITPGAEFHSLINHQLDNANCPDYFKNTNNWLNIHNQLMCKDRSDKNPHDLSLHHFIAKPISNDEPSYTIYDLINRFIKKK